VKKQARRYRGLVYRAHNPRWAFLPISGEGAARWGGRFNPIGTPALYTSERFETAWLEAQQGFSYKTQPLLLCSYDVDCSHILDLTNPMILERLGVEPDELNCPWELLADERVEPPTWALARRCIEAGIQGARVPSFARGATVRDINLVFWSWSEQAPNRVVVIDDEQRLPRNSLSWQDNEN